MFKLAQYIALEDLLNFSIPSKVLRPNAKAIPMSSRNMFSFNRRTNEQHYVRDSAQSQRNDEPD